MKVFLIVVFLIVSLSLAPPASAGLVPFVAWEVLDDGVDSIGESIIEALRDFSGAVLEWVESTLVPLLGVDFDPDDLTGSLDWWEVQAKGLNSVIPLFSGLGIVLGGVVAQWAVLLLRYVFGWFVGG